LARRGLILLRHLGGSLSPTHVYRLGRHASASQAASIIKTGRADDQLWLVLPWGVRWGRNLLDLRRLAHVASNAGVDLRLVCARAQVRMLAREAGIPPYFMLPLVLRNALEHVEGQPKPGRTLTGATIRLRRPRHLTLRAFALAVLATAVLLAAIAATLAVVLPSAEITLLPVTRQTAVNFAATASPFRREIDYSKALLPARVVQVLFEESVQMPTTGRADVPDGYASGQIVFANRSDRQVVVPKGTFVRTGSGETARFYTVEEAVVPGQYNATERVPILAADAGPTSNVRALTINVIEGELSTMLEAINDAPTSGGTMRQLPVVTPADQNALLDRARQELGELAMAQLAAELEEGELISPNTFDSQIMSYKFDQVQGERSDVASLSIKLVAKATAIQSKDMDLLATRFIESQAGDDLGLVPGTLQVTRASEQAGEGGEVIFQVTASGRVATEIDPELIRGELRGLLIPAAAAWLSTEYELAAPPTITILPPQWERLPLLPARTHVRIEVDGQ
jgi:hypothetical protein